MQHLEEGEIHAWLDGALSEAESARIEQHAATCTECAAMVADARGLIAGAARIVSALDHVPSGVIPKSGTAATASRPLWRVLRLTPFRAAMAASLMVVAGSLFVLQGGDKMSAPMRMTAAAPAIAPTPASPTADTSQRIDAPAANPTRPLAEARGSRPQQSVAKTTLALKDTGLLMKQADSIAPAVPAPKVASAQDERAKKERDAAVSSVVAPAPPVNALSTAARSAGRGGAATQTAAREPFRDSTRADISLRRPLPLAMQRAEGASSFVNFLGCYQVVDSTEWPRPLPVWFEMVRDSDRVHLIRPGVEQRPAIGRWQNSGPQSAAVTLDGSNTASFTLTQIGTELLATPASAPSARIRVLRSSCAR